jgi:hypothetical protein
MNAYNGLIRDVLLYPDNKSRELEDFREAP